jgi:hypothetical protein
MPADARSACISLRANYVSGVGSNTA